MFVRVLRLAALLPAAVMAPQGLCAAAVFIAQTSSTSEQYPNRPIRLIVPFPPGGGTDIVARAVTAKLVEGWGQQVIIDNRGGAGGVIGADTVAKSTPDGYTLLFGTPGALVINPLMNSKLPYNALQIGRAHI